MKLLYAEDEPAMAEAVEDILTYHHYLVDRMADGEEALAYARAETYDGIILDIISLQNIYKRFRECCSRRRFSKLSIRSVW